MGASGTVQVDFGAFPGNKETSVTVSGQAGFVATSLLEAWQHPTADTTDHTVREQTVDWIVVQGTEPSTGQFIIRAYSPDNNNRYGLYLVAWAWL